MNLLSMLRGPKSLRERGERVAASRRVYVELGEECAISSAAQGHECVHYEPREEEP